MKCPLCESDSWLIKVLCELESRIFMFQCKNMGNCGLCFWKLDHPIKFRRKNLQND